MSAKGNAARKVSIGGQPMANGEAFAHKDVADAPTSRISQRILY